MVPQPAATGRDEVLLTLLIAFCISLITLIQVGPSHLQRIVPSTAAITGPPKARAKHVCMTNVNADRGRPETSFIGCCRMMGESLSEVASSESEARGSRARGRVGAPLPACGPVTQTHCQWTESSGGRGQGGWPGGGWGVIARRAGSSRVRLSFGGPQAQLSLRGPRGARLHASPHTPPARPIHPSIHCHLTASLASSVPRPSLT